MRIILCTAMSSLALMMTPIAYAQSAGAPPVALQQPATYPPAGELWHGACRRSGVYSA
jgi:hypothetical protein